MALFGLSPVAGGLQAPVSNDGALPVGRAVAAMSVRSPTAIPGKAAFDKLRPGKPCPTGNPVAVFPTP